MNEQNELEEARPPFFYLLARVKSLPPDSSTSIQRQPRKTLTNTDIHVKRGVTTMQYLVASEAAHPTSWEMLHCE